MRANSLAIIGLLLTAALVPAAVAAAQDGGPSTILQGTSTDWDRAGRSAIEEGYELRITLLGGNETHVLKGDAVDFDASSITIETNAIPEAQTGLTASSTGGVFNRYHVRVPKRRIARIDRARSDSLLNGALIGAGVGFGAGFLLSGSACGFGSFDETCAAVVGIFTLGGMGLGVGADAARKSNSEILYVAHPELPDYRFHFAPLVSGGKKGALFTIRW